jgi:tetratricopeptide (TPR) repeat protein
VSRSAKLDAEGVAPQPAGLEPDLLGAGGRRGGGAAEEEAARGVARDLQWHGGAEADRLHPGRDPGGGGGEGAIDPERGGAEDGAVGVVEPRPERAGGAPFEVLARAEALVEEAPSAAASVLLYRGRAALLTGDLRAALDAFRKAYERASRLGMEMDVRRARRYLVTALRTLGRDREAVDIQRALVAAPSPDACERSDDWVTLALTIGETARGEPEGAEALLARGEAELAGCPDPGKARNIAVEQLLRSIERGDLAEARRRERKLSSLTGRPTPLLQVWELEARARLALLAGRTGQAVAAFEEQLAMAQRVGLEEEQFRAMVALGQALEADRRRTPAIDAYRRAEALLARQLGRVPLGEGVFGFMRAHRQSAEQLVDALLRLDSPAEALEAARLAEARPAFQISQAHRIGHLAGDHKRRWEEAAARYQRLRAELEADTADWRQSAARAGQRRDERMRQARDALDDALRIAGEPSPGTRLRPPAPGELFLAFTHVRDGWIGFAAAGGGRPDPDVRALRLGAIDPAAPAASLARQLLDPFGSAIRAARRIRLLLPEVLWRRDVHALSVGGKPLLAQAPVSFGLDVPPPACPSGCGGARARGAGAALLVADPTLDLHGARAETAELAAAVAASGFLVSQLPGLAATHARVLPLLRAASLFHYAGHARPGPREGLEGVLPLAQGTRLLVADVLALDRVPDRVVLSACEAALLADADGGLSMAHAFILAGARAVVASTRPVGDVATRALMTALYGSGLADLDRDPAEVLRAVQLARWRQGGGQDPNPGDDWVAFRVLSP